MECGTKITKTGPFSVISEGRRGGGEATDWFSMKLIKAVLRVSDTTWSFSRRKKVAGRSRYRRATRMLSKWCSLKWWNSHFDATQKNGAFREGVPGHFYL